MKILATDTATLHCSVAVCEDLTLLAETNLFRRQTHSRHLLEMIHQTISIAGISLNEIDAFAVTQGPGSFTGLRIGLSCVKGLAYATGKPMIAVSTLETLAYQAAVNVDKKDFLICPLLDARKNEVYFAGFLQKNNQLTITTQEMVLPPEKIALHVEGPCFFLGNGAIMYKNILEKIFKNSALFAPPHQNYVRSHTVAILAINRFKNGNIDDISTIVPKYIRKSDAERKFLNVTQ